MKTELYTIETLSNLHVGSGDINFDVIDNQVQRDVTTKLPTIHSSSLKGAFREHFSTFDEDGKKEQDSKMVRYIFGGANNEGQAQAGAYSFFEASLLTRPVRSNKKAYFNATSTGVITTFLELIEDFDIDFDEELKDSLLKLSKLNVNGGTPLIFENLSGVILEDYEATISKENVAKVNEFLGENLALFNDEDFKNLDLPVLARNYLEDGVSKNLWYEEVVPKKSKFYFVIAKPTNIDEVDYENKIKSFESRFTKEGANLQIGANKSIGYGFTKVTKVSK